MRRRRWRGRLHRCSLPPTAAPSERSSKACWVDAAGAVAIFVLCRKAVIVAKAWGVVFEVAGDEWSEAFFGISPE